MNSVPREGLSPELLDWISILKEKGVGDDEYDSMLQIPNDLPTLRNYYSQISIVDDGVGRVLDALENKTFKQNYLCPDYKKFFTHIKPYMKIMGEELKNQRSASNIVKILKNRNSQKNATKRN
jgi:hypothetical protein